MSDTTLTEQLARIKAGDKVTATIRNGRGNLYQCIGEAWEAGRFLYVGEACLRGSETTPGNRLISIDAHESVLPEVTEEPTDPGVRLVDKWGDEWARVWAKNRSPHHRHCWAAGGDTGMWEFFASSFYAPFTVIDADGNPIGTVGGDDTLDEGGDE